MMIEIRKAGFKNKGAELMLHAIVQMIRKKMPDARMCMEARPSKPYEKRAALGLYQKLHLQNEKTRFLSDALGRCIPKRVRDIYGIVRDREIDVVFDASGYSYTDRWKVSSCTQLAQLSKTWKKHGVKIILLPQAFGPFEKSVSTKAMIDALENIDLVFAREQESYDHLVALGGRTDHIRIAPDFTNLIEGTPPVNSEPYQGYCIIPNYRMLQKTAERDRACYRPFLAKCISRLQAQQRQAFMLIHESGNDEALADEINRMLSVPLPIVREADPLKIKGIIGCSAGVIASRYHGLVNALSQGVPSLATSWSHKYQMLFNDYGLEEGLLDLHVADDELYRQIDRLMDTSTRHHLIETLNEKSMQLKQQTMKMWADVLNCLSAQGGL
jgi:colanic acid/amylovoran biosynthesis protein